jgi:hypothetical protein
VTALVGCTPANDVALAGIAAARSDHSEVVARLRAAGFIVTGDTTRSGDLNTPRRIEAQFEQPVDHDRAPRHDRALRHEGTRGPHFRQNVHLYPAASDAPVVVDLCGYDLGICSYAGELKQLLPANYVVVEYRFFGGSRPQPPDWNLLTVKQAAEDHQAIVQALKSVFPHQAFITTGYSKGGEAALAHRSFYPDAVAGTVVYSTPAPATLGDPRLARFLDQRPCRDKIHAAQQELLARRAEMQDAYLKLEAKSPARATYNRLTFDVAYELMVVELHNSLWEFGGEASCGMIPRAGAPATEWAAFLKKVSGPEQFSDGALEHLAPYFFQCARELGYPKLSEAGLALRYPGFDHPHSLLPKGVMPPAFDDRVPRKVADWVVSQGSHLLFIYGGSDPVSAMAYQLEDGASGRDAQILFAQGGNHHVFISQLADARASAERTLQTWIRRPRP